MHDIQTLTGWPELSHLTETWQELLASCQAGTQGPDLSSGPAWAEALCETLVANQPVIAAVLKRDGRPTALLPVFRSRATGILGVRQLNVLSEAHCGRAGLLALGNDSQQIEMLLTKALREISNWDLFKFSVVEDSAAHRAVLAALRKQSLRIHCLSRTASPFIELPQSWGELFARLPKKMRWTIKKSERDLIGTGRLDYEEILAPSQVDSFLDAMRCIESESWKEKAGTSITSNLSQIRFYETLIPIAAREGWLSSHVLRLDGKPIAYIFGLADGNVFLDQKESYVLGQAENSPGHVLKRYAIPRLMERGIRIYDFMGSCEPYKMRWTNNTYSRLSLILYGRTWRGHAAYVRTILLGKFPPLL